jgi:Lipoprotein LpqB beta-propeller domain
MRATGARGRRLRRYGWMPVCAALLLVGCASTPDSGEVRKVGDVQHADSDSQVRVFGIPPEPGESPSQIVSGFLEATTSSETDFATAKKYLAKGVAAHWDPYAGITVLSEFRSAEDDGPSRKEGSATVNLSGKKAAVVDTEHTYRPDQGTYQAGIHLTRQSDNQWRIDDLPDGLVLSETDFQRIYHSANLYYFADLGADDQRDSRTAETLVADPVFLPSQTDSLAATVAALLSGPTDWLDPVVTTAAPAGARLYAKAPDHGVTLDDSQDLKVRLDRSADGLPQQSCRRLAAQLFATVQSQASARLSSAEVQRADGSMACKLPANQASAYRTDTLVGYSPRQYFISADTGHRLMMLASDSATRATQVSGPFGVNKPGLESVAVRRDQLMAAGVRDTGRALVVGSLVDDRPFGRPAVTSEVKGGLSAPSWDGFGDLWVADRDPADPRLLVLRGGSGQPAEVSVPGADGRVESLRVASDGVRIALIVSKAGKTSLEIGRIERAGSSEQPEISVTGLRPLTPDDENITSVSWAGESRLVTLGSEVGGAQQIEYVNTDGSAGAALQGVSEAASVAASENQKKPLLASYKDSVYRLPPTADANWKQVTPKGGSPVYPG